MYVWHLYNYVIWYTIILLNQINKNNNSKKTSSLIYASFCSYIQFVLFCISCSYFSPNNIQLHRMIESRIAANSVFIYLTFIRVNIEERRGRCFGENGRLTGCTPAKYSILGYTLDDPTGLSIFDGFDSHDFRAAAKLLAWSNVFQLPLGPPDGIGRNPLAESPPRTLLYIYRNEQPRGPGRMVELRSCLRKNCSAAVAHLEIVSWWDTFMLESTSALWKVSLRLGELCPTPSVIYSCLL